MDEFSQKLVSFAGRMVSIAPRCVNEESTKLFLILPFLNLLGYDDRNPLEVCPEHSADFSDRYKNRVDFAILKNDLPVIAIECKACGTPLKDERGQLRSYFNAAPTVKMGVLTDGLVYEFYADSDEPNLMDGTAFLTVDLRQVAKSKVEESVLDGLRGLQKATFDPENIGAEAKRKLIFQNLLQQIDVLAESPSEQFTRMLLQCAGVSHVRSKTLAEYQALTRTAFNEFINRRILRRLDLPSKEAERPTPTAEIQPTDSGTTKADDKLVASEVGLAVFEHAKRRLAFLVKDEMLFHELGNLQCRAYQGKFVVFYRRERKGRLFDLYEGVGPRLRVCFSDGTEIVGEKPSDLALDKPLFLAFVGKVEQESGARTSTAAV